MNNKRNTLYSEVWSNIRGWQKNNSVSEARLAADLRVNERTLKEYDKSAHNLTLEKIDNLLTAEKISFSDLISERAMTTITHQSKYFVWEAHSKTTVKKK